jgi:hypothetical protein
VDSLTSVGRVPDPVPSMTPPLDGRLGVVAMVAVVVVVIEVFAVAVATSPGGVLGFVVAPAVAILGLSGGNWATEGVHLQGMRCVFI